VVEGKFTVSGDTCTRVGFALSPSAWLGGRNYQRNLFTALRSLPGNPITPVLFAKSRNDGASVDFPEVEIVRTSILDRKNPAWFVRKIINKAASQDILLQKLLQRHSITVVSHSFQLDFDPGTQSGVKTIGWIPDFQHIHMPEFFEPNDRTYRDRNFLSTCKRCDKVIVSSQCARTDLCTLFPEYAHKAELLRFIANPAPITQAISFLDLEQLYGFKGPYFLLPNQFWAHKNHRVVLNALRELKLQGRPYLVLATGSTKDYRNPSFFPSLMQYATDCGVLDCFRVLGQIPFDHLVGLMRHAVAFINPSRFEGWSTSVEEAKSMGKQIVLSDLPVHREQDPQRGFYFPAEEPEVLAMVMRTAYEEFDPRIDAEMQDAARTQFPERQRAFGEAYLHIVQRTTGHRTVSF
jgi:glycosyltransferase involved in cell wall biosynthesis